MTRIPHSRPTLVPGMVEAVQAVIESGQHAGGSVRRELEQGVAERVDAKEAVAVQSGFAALHLALLSVGVESGHPVVVPSYVCASLLHALAAVGAEPIVADVDPRTFNLTAETVRAAVQREVGDPEATRAIIAPHILGVPIDRTGWNFPCPVIEDCAMAIGAHFEAAPGDEPREVGSWGSVSVFSFYATKMLSSGQGGMLLTDDPAIAADARDRLHYDNRDSWRPCWNYPMPDLAAALAKAQLPALDDFLAARSQQATRYQEAFEDLNVTWQQVPTGATSNNFRFTLVLNDSDTRDGVQAKLEESDIESKSPVYRPLHDYLELDPEHYPATTSIQARALSLPIYPSLTMGEQDRVIEGVRSALTN